MASNKEETRLENKSNMFAIKLKSTFAESDDFVMYIDGSETITNMKKKISEEYPGHPPANSQSLIYAGRILDDDNKSLAELITLSPRKTSSNKSDSAFHSERKLADTGFASSSEETGEGKTFASATIHIVVREDKAVTQNSSRGFRENSGSSNNVTSIAGGNSTSSIESGSQATFDFGALENHAELNQVVNGAGRSDGEYPSTSGSNHIENQTKASNLHESRTEIGISGITPTRCNNNSETVDAACCSSSSNQSTTKNLEDEHTGSIERTIALLQTYTAIQQEYARELQEPMAAAMFNPIMAAALKAAVSAVVEKSSSSSNVSCEEGFGKAQNDNLNAPLNYLRQFPFPTYPYVLPYPYGAWYPPSTFSIPPNDISSHIANQQEEQQQLQQQQQQEVQNGEHSQRQQDQNVGQQLQRQDGGVAPVVARVRVIRIDLKLLLKLAIIIFVFNQDGDTIRLTTMISCALVYYLYRMGIFGGWINVPVGNNNDNVARNNNGDANANANGNNIDAGVAAAIQEIERNSANNNQMQFLSNFLLRQQPGIRREMQTFLIGFLGSLLPSWNAPNLIEAEVRARNSVDNIGERNDHIDASISDNNENAINHMESTDSNHSVDPSDSQQDNSSDNIDHTVMEGSTINSDSATCHAQEQEAFRQNNKKGDEKYVNENDSPCNE